ncbi:ferritin-like domain-containing protein [Thermomicrobium sp.]
MDKKTLIDGLNQDLAGEFQAIIMYIHYAASATGVDRIELAEFFQKEIQDELRHALFLANKITALGGEPVDEPLPVPKARSNREMIERVLEAEERTIKSYVERMKQAEEFGDYGLANDLQEIISDETRHKEECEKLLRGVA